MMKLSFWIVTYFISDFQRDALYMVWKTVSFISDYSEIRCANYIF